jgi:ABC-type antimicrobial peptide transport system permease subunit
MVLRTAMGWATTGALLGMGAALVAGRLVSSLLFGLDPADPATILVATAVLLLVAALAGYWPARRASRLNPVIALRYE